MIRSPHTDSDFFRPRNPPTPVAPQNVESCCIWDSVQCVEQPWTEPAQRADQEKELREAIIQICISRGAEEAGVGVDEGLPGEYFLSADTKMAPKLGKASSPTTGRSLAKGAA